MVLKKVQERNTASGRRESGINYGVCLQIAKIHKENQPGEWGFMKNYMQKPALHR